MAYLCEDLQSPARLYIKQCSHCELKYFGKTIRKSIEDYQGSGKKWNNHLKKHNSVAIHLWNSKWYYDTSITRFATKFSKINNIMGSDIWANLKEENGLDGGWETVVWDDMRRKLKSEERKGMNTLRKKDGTTFFGNITDINYVDVFPSRYNRVYVKDRNGNTFNVEKDDPRFATGEIFGLNKGKVGLADHLNKNDKKCVHCGFVTTKGNIVRWHNDNCKERK